jgi:putative addiction module component (TIGR02574 family)
MDGTTLSELLKLTEAERIQLAQDLWDSIPADSASVTPTDAGIDEWERRLAEHVSDPTSAIPWEEARLELRDRFGA